MLANAILLLVMLLTVGTLLVATLVVAMAMILLRPQRMTDGRAVFLLKRLSPGDLGLNFEPIDFRVRDERTGASLKIAAWWIPNPRAGGKCAILIHGYADAKVGAIAWAPTLHELGFNILAIDLRAHGESGGVYSTAGYFERYDLNQVIDRLLADRPAQAKPLVLFGVSLGAAVAVATAALRDDIAAVVLECPFADYRQVVLRHGDLMRLPSSWLQRCAIRLAERLSSADFDQVRPADLLPRLKCPVVVIQACGDEFVPQEDAKQIEVALAQRALQNGPTEYWRVSGAGHVLAMEQDASMYARRLRGFFDNALQANRIGIDADI